MAYTSGLRMLAGLRSQRRELFRFYRVYGVWSLRAGFNVQPNPYTPELLGSDFAVSWVSPAPVLRKHEEQEERRLGSRGF